jgi:hypothetical protein
MAENEIKVLLDAKDFTDLVSGKVITKQQILPGKPEVLLALSDIGYDLMLDIIMNLRGEMFSKLGCKDMND